MFDELMERSAEQVMGAYFRQMAEGLQNIDPGAARAVPRHAGRAERA